MAKKSRPALTPIIIPSNAPFRLPSPALPVPKDPTRAPARITRAPSRKQPTRTWSERRPAVSPLSPSTRAKVRESRPVVSPLSPSPPPRQPTRTRPQAGTHPATIRAPSVKKQQTRFAAGTRPAPPARPHAMKYTATLRENKPGYHQEARRVGDRYPSTRRAYDPEAQTGGRQLNSSAAQRRTSSNSCIAGWVIVFFFCFVGLVIGIAFSVAAVKKNKS
ncbi:hypothetical protein MMC28_001889 [Mycoblastus sanguinarius]|nr:hypothetical protein [Mycoblastus sanguinarius]